MKPDFAASTWALNEDFAKDIVCPLSPADDEEASEVNVLKLFIPSTSGEFWRSF